MKKIVLYFLCFFIFTIPIENMFQLGDLGTISKFMGYLLFFLMLIYVFNEGKIRNLTTFHVLFFIFVLWGAITYFWSFDKILTFQRILTNVQLLIMIWIIWEFSGDNRSRLMVLQSYVYGSMVATIATIMSYIINKDSGIMRFAAEGFDPNELSLAIVISIPLAWYLSLETKKVYFINRIYIALGYFAIILTASRTSFIISLIALLYIFITFNQLSKKARISLSLLTLVISSYIYTLVPQSSFERLSTVGSELSEGSLNDRTTIWKYAISLFYNNWFGGVGAGALPYAILPYYGRPAVAHNTFLSILVEQGIIGFIIYVLIIFYLIHLIKFSNSKNRNLYITILIIICVGTSLLSWEFRKILWLSLAIIASESNRYREVYDNKLY
jgi:O-antigen ligase